MSPDIEQWPTDEAAAAILGTSSKTIHRYAAKKWIEMRKRQRPGKKPENVCNPLDIEKLKPPPHVMAADRFGEVENLSLATTEGKLTFAYLFNELLRSNAPPQPLPPPAPWITLEEAADYSGLSRTYLRDSCVGPEHYKEGENLLGIRGGPRGALRIRRASLEAFQG